MAVQIKVKNTEKIEELAKRVGELPDRLVPLLRKTSNKTAILIQAEARRLSPVDTGRLRNSMQVSLGINFLGAIVGTDLDYAEYVHQGTAPHIAPIEELRGWARRKGIDPHKVQHGIAKRGTKAQPFLEDAVKNKANDITKLFEDALGEGLQYLKR